MSDKFLKTVLPDTNKKNLPNETLGKHGHVIRFQNVYCTIDGFLSSLPRY